MSEHEAIELARTNQQLESRRDHRSRSPAWSTAAPSTRPSSCELARATESGSAHRRRLLRPRQVQGGQRHARPRRRRRRARRDRRPPAALRARRRHRRAPGRRRVRPAPLPAAGRAPRRRSPSASARRRSPRSARTSPSATSSARSAPASASPSGRARARPARRSSRSPTRRCTWPSAAAAAWCCPPRSPASSPPSARPATPPAPARPGAKRRRNPRPRARVNANSTLAAFSPSQRRSILAAPRGREPTTSRRRRKGSCIRSAERSTEKLSRDIIGGRDEHEAVLHACEATIERMVGDSALLRPAGARAVPRRAAVLRHRRLAARVAGRAGLRDGHAGGHRPDAAHRRRRQRQPAAVPGDDAARDGVPARAAAHERLLPVAPASRRDGGDRGRGDRRR